MNELEFFLGIFPQEYELLQVDKFVDFTKGKFIIDKELDDFDVPRQKSEGPVCECVGENTNKNLFLYFQSIINQGIEIPVYINNKNQIMDGYHRFHAYYFLGRKEIPIYRNKLWRNHGFCWKSGLEGRRRLRLKSW